MCSRYSVAKEARLDRRFGVRKGLASFGPRFNIAPTQEAPVILTGDEAVLMPWGLEAGGKRLINARAETLSEKASFREAFRTRRCLIPADGFYEWHHKQPRRFTLAQGELFAFAGLWEGRAFTVVTTEANGLVRKVHDRMPVILRREDERRWLAGEDVPLGPLAAEAMRACDVSPVVNSPRVDDPRCIEETPELPF